MSNSLFGKIGAAMGIGQQAAATPAPGTTLTTTVSGTTLNLPQTGYSYTLNPQHQNSIYQQQLAQAQNVYGQNYNWGNQAGGIIGPQYAQQYQAPPTAPLPNRSFDSPGMAPDLIIVARMWLCKYGDSWVTNDKWAITKDDEEGMYYVFKERLCSKKWMEEVYGYVRLLPEDLWK